MPGCELLRPPARMDGPPDLGPGGGSSRSPLPGGVVVVGQRPPETARCGAPAASLTRRRRVKKTFASTGRPIGNDIATRTILIARVECVRLRWIQDDAESQTGVDLWAHKRNMSVPTRTIACRRPPGLQPRTSDRNEPQQAQHTLGCCAALPTRLQRGAPCPFAHRVPCWRHLAVLDSHSE